MEQADVVLFVDTFTRYFEPENAHAALRVLGAAGYRVAVAQAPRQARPLCCGRTYLTAGLVDEARTHARRMIAALAPAVERGAVRSSGSSRRASFRCATSILVMGLGEDAARLAAQGMLIEEFLAREQQEGKLRLPLRALPQSRALLHGHCHQKAFDVMATDGGGIEAGAQTSPSTSSSRAAAAWPGASVTRARTTTCRSRMAELSLLPAVRKADADTLIVADGTSCRHQIADGAGREAMHVIRVLERALDQGVVQKATPSGP